MDEQKLVILEMIASLSSSVEQVIDFLEDFHDTFNWRGTEENMELIKKLDTAKSYIYDVQDKLSYIQTLKEE